MDKPASPSALSETPSNISPGVARAAFHLGVNRCRGGRRPARFPSTAPLRPGFVTYTCRVPAGTTRDLFLAMTSLMPGSLPTEVDERGVLLMHCLDTDQPLADQMADTEARLLRALEGPGTNA